MILYEFEGKEILGNNGIKVPRSEVIENLNQPVRLKVPIVLKAQVLSGKRANSGGIIKVLKEEDVSGEIIDLFGKKINGERVNKVLVEDAVGFAKEYYISISYDTLVRLPVLTLSLLGGTGVEEREKSMYPINILEQQVVWDKLNQKGLTDTEIVNKSRSKFLNDLDLFLTNKNKKSFLILVQKLINIFFENDCLLLEINPLVITKTGEWIALDAKIKIDDDARFRHKEWNFPPRSVPGHEPTNSEVAAKQIDLLDYRGTAGSTYFDLPGDIAILSSGGGVSLTAMDALIEYGGKPANFTEYSGNPPKEKVVKLTEIVLSKPNIHGLWIIGTVAANFTDIYETLLGIIEGLREVEKKLDKKFKFPILIRRGGPREEEAFDMLRKVKDFQLYVYGEEATISQSAKIMVDLVNKYKKIIDS